MGGSELGVGTKGLVGYTMPLRGCDACSRRLLGVQFRMDDRETADGEVHTDLVGMESCRFGFRFALVCCGGGEAGDRPSCVKWGDVG